MDKNEKALELMQSGNECLEVFDSDGAIKIGRKLIKMRYSGGFELLARAYHQDDELEKAIETLETGVKETGKSWYLWYLLGVYYTDAGKFENAHEAYDKALKIDNCDHDLVTYEKCVTFAREGQSTEAINICESLIRKDMENVQLDSQARLMLMTLYNDEENWKKTIELGSKHEYVVSEIDEELEEQEWLAEVFARFSYALFRSGDLEKARKYLSVSLKLDHCLSYALFALREMNNFTSSSAKYFRILVHGRLGQLEQDSEEEICFFSSCDVIADNEEEAIEYLKEVFPTESADSLEVEESEVLEDRPGDYKGVYRSSGFSMYDCDAEE